MARKSADSGVVLVNMGSLGIGNEEWRFTQTGMTLEAALAVDSCPQETGGVCAQGPNSQSTARRSRREHFAVRNSGLRGHPCSR